MKNTTEMSDLELVKALKACGMRFDTTTRNKRQAIVAELVKRPIFEEVCKAKGMNKAEFIKLGESLNLI